MSGDSRRVIIYTVVGAWAIWGTGIVVRALFLGPAEIPHLGEVLAFVAGASGFVGMLVERMLTQTSHERRRENELRAQVEAAHRQQ